MGGSCADLTPTQFHKVLLHFSPTKLELLCCHLRACQLTDELLQALIKKRLRNMLFPSTVPVDGGNFCVTDEGIVDFLLQGDIPMDEEEDPPSRLCGDLRVYNSSPTKDLFKRLVGVSSQCLIRYKPAPSMTWYLGSTSLSGTVHYVVGGGKGLASICGGCIFS